MSKSNIISLIEKTKCGIHISINNHRDNYQKVEQYFNERMQYFSSMKEDIE